MLGFTSLSTTRCTQRITFSGGRFGQRSEGLHARRHRQHNFGRLTRCVRIADRHTNHWRCVGCCCSSDTLRSLRFCRTTSLLASPERVSLIFISDCRAPQRTN